MSSSTPSSTPNRPNIRKTSDVSISGGSNDSMLPPPPRGNSRQVSDAASIVSTSSYNNPSSLCSSPKPLPSSSSSSISTPVTRGKKTPVGIFHARQPSDGSVSVVSSSNMGGGVGMSSTPVRGATLARAIPLVTRQLSDADTSVCSMTSAQSNVNIVPRFSIAELKVESYLGEGGFCMVHAIAGFDLQDERKHAQLLAAKMCSEHELELRRRIVQTSEQNGNVMYVVKRMKNNMSPEEERKAIADLAIEAGFLSRICHNNVINMAGIADQDPHSANFFILIDRLFETLEKRIEKRWRRDLDDASGFWWGCCMNHAKIQDLWDVRLGAALDLAKAFHYLHCNHIIYRDLKPGNIGFDFNGVVKIFDFGLAKDLSEQKRDPNTGLYLLTGVTGSLRYMAPEVSLKQPYDEKADVYSFGILLWQICSLLMPFPRYSKEMHRNLVVEKGERPSVDVAWQSGLSALIQKCWVANGASRPDFGSVIRALEREILILRYSEDSKSSNNGKALAGHSVQNDLDKKYNASFL